MSNVEKISYKKMFHIELNPFLPYTKCFREYSKVCESQIFDRNCYSRSPFRTKPCCARKSFLYRIVILLAWSPVENHLKNLIAIIVRNVISILAPWMIFVYDIFKRYELRYEIHHCVYTAPVGRILKNSIANLLKNAISNLTSFLGCLCAVFSNLWIWRSTIVYRMHL